MKNVKLSLKNARYYNPSIGRFIQRDPIGFSSGDNNLYRYVSNKPVNHRDPTGNLSPASLVACMAAFAVGGVYDYYSSISDQSKLQDKLDRESDEEVKQCKNEPDKIKHIINDNKRSTLVQANAYKNAASAYLPGAGSAMALGSCVLMLSTF